MSSSWVLLLIQNAIEVHSKSLPEIQSFLGRLPVKTLFNIRVCFQKNSKGVPSISTMALVELLNSILQFIRLTGGTIIIVVDSFHLLRTFQADLGYVAKMCFSNNHGLSGMHIRFVLAGENLDIESSPISRTWLVTESEECFGKREPPVHHRYIIDCAQNLSHHSGRIEKVLDRTRSPLLTQEPIIGYGHILAIYDGARVMLASCG